MRELTVGELRYISESTDSWRMYIYGKKIFKERKQLNEEMQRLSQEYTMAFQDFYKSRVEKDPYENSVEIQAAFDNVYKKINPAFYDINSLIGRDIRLTGDVLGDDNLKEYIPYLSNTEVRGIMRGDLTGIGIYNELDGQPEGLGVVEILPEYIRIHRVCTCMDVSEQLIWERLVDYIKQLPQDLQLPTYVITAGSAAKEKLEAVGFASDNRRFLYEIGVSSDLKPISYKKNKEMKVVFLEDVEEEPVLDFISNASFDPFFQLPYADIKADNLSGSIVCKVKNQIQAMLLIEEDEDCIRIPWYYYKNKEAMDACFAVLKNLLEREYDADISILFLDSGKNKKELMNYFSGKIKELPIYAYRLQ